MLRSKLLSVAAAMALTAGGAVGSALLSAAPAHAGDGVVNVCVGIPSGSISSEPCSTVPPDQFAVEVEAAATDEAPCDQGTGVVGTGVEVCAAGEASVSAESTGVGTTSPGGEVEACVAGVGCSGFESDTASGGEG